MEAVLKENNNTTNLKESKNNIVGLNIDTPLQTIQSFLNTYDSENTQKNYIKYYENMFMYLYNKEINQLTWEDINSIDIVKVKKYREFLVRQKQANSSINQKIAACKALWDEFLENRQVEPVDYGKTRNCFDIKRLKQTNEHMDTLTIEEVNNLLDFCGNYPFKGETIKLYFEFLFTVNCRKHVAQELTWDDIVQDIDSDTHKKVWVVKKHDKTGNIARAISHKFYEALRDNFLKEKSNITDRRFENHVFLGISDTTYKNVLKKFCKENGLEDRKIGQHSIRSAKIDYTLEITGNISKTAFEAGHEIGTTQTYYANKQKRKYTSQSSYNLGLRNNFNINKLKELDKDSIIKLIENCGQTVIDRLNIELIKMENENRK